MMYTPKQNKRLSILLNNTPLFYKTGNKNRIEIKKKRHEILIKYPELFYKKNH